MEKQRSCFTHGRRNQRCEGEELQGTAPRLRVFWQMISPQSGTGKLLRLGGRRPKAKQGQTGRSIGVDHWLHVHSRQAGLKAAHSSEGSSAPARSRPRRLWQLPRCRQHAPCSGSSSFRATFTKYTVRASLIYTITSNFALPPPRLHPHWVTKAWLNDSVGCCWRRKPNSFWNTLQTTAASKALKKITLVLEISPLQYHFQFESNILLRSPEDNNKAHCKFRRHQPVGKVK